MRTTILAAALAVALAGVSTAVADTADSAAAAAGPVPAVTVGTDPVGDWGGGGDAAAAGHVLGQDLLSAAIGMPDAKTVEFVMEVSFLPSAGGVPEATRYTWNFEVDKRPFELDGKFTNYSRGACDPTSGQCPPPRDPGPAPFLLRGDCVTGDGNVTLCKELARLSGQFSPGDRTIRVRVPGELLGTSPCSVVRGGANLFGGSVSASPSAFFSSSAAPLDTLDIGKAFQVPSADPVATPCP